MWLVWSHIVQKASHQLKYIEFYYEFTYGVNNLQDVRFTIVYIAAHKIYDLLQTPCLLPHLANVLVRKTSMLVQM